MRYVFIFDACIMYVNLRHFLWEMENYVLAFLGRTHKKLAIFVCVYIYLVRVFIVAKLISSFYKLGMSEMLYANGWLRVQN